MMMKQRCLVRENMIFEFLNFYGGPTQILKLFLSATLTDDFCGLLTV